MTERPLRPGDEYRTPDTGSVRRETDVTVVTPTDRVRWGPVLAGVFSALSAMAILSLLGLAIGLSTYDVNDRARSYGLGAGIWSGISALISFFIGGWVAARSAAVRGAGNGVLNGSMVWAVAIPVLIYLLIGGIGSIAQTAAHTAGTVAGPEARQAAERQGTNITGQPSGTTQGGGQMVSPQTVEQTRQTASRAAWGTLIPLLLSLGAAALGGYTGNRPVGSVSEPRSDRPGPVTT